VQRGYHHTVQTPGQPQPIARERHKHCMCNALTFLRARAL
jgi:hypothetical protein